MTSLGKEQPRLLGLDLYQMPKIRKIEWNIEVRFWEGIWHNWTFCDTCNSETEGLLQKMFAMGGTSFVIRDAINTIEWSFREAICVQAWSETERLSISIICLGADLPLTMVNEAYRSVRLSLPIPELANQDFQMMTYCLFRWHLKVSFCTSSLCSKHLLPQPVTNPNHQWCLLMCWRN